MRKVFSTISCNLDTNILSACLPLFEDEKIEAIEWSFDTLYKHKTLPDWFTELLLTFGKDGRLIGHGVYFSLFSGLWTKEQQDWLNHLQQVNSEFQFNHISEHFGFMTGKDFHQGAPISVPFSSSTLRLGQDRLKRISHACRCPVGLENLAFSYSLDEVKRHGEFLDQLLVPVNGFIILDLHNVYCQSHNFKIAFDNLIQLYPLHRVREIHISGGSWQDSPTDIDHQIRRDTHDDSVPDDVFSFLQQTVDDCPSLKFVVLEQLGTGLAGEAKQATFRNDFLKMSNIVDKANNDNTLSELNHFLPEPFVISTEPEEDKSLSEQQRVLSNILETASSYTEARNSLDRSILANTSWKTENWHPDMLITAMAIAQKWKNGFE